MNKEFWDERFASQEYAYGKQGSQFVKSQLEQLKPGKLLLPAEGEGRNAVTSALQGWEVTAFDISEEGRRKAMLLADDAGVQIEYELKGFDTFEAEAESFDAVALVYAHTFPEVRNAYHRKLIGFLKPGGTLILEGFSKEQFGKPSGGPKVLEMLFDEEMLMSDFGDLLTDIRIEKVSQLLDEGTYHQGEASLIRLVGKKR
ncbi:methyltransferase domain-containing protein [Limibacter armeniacum]|uniref:class I SAM-dependent methyltransferase n=1 Tax=Limibacter armeniacum TaxID=466084 RepID=UPI002FE61C05